MRVESFGELLADVQDGRERGQRILKDHGNAAAANGR